MPLYWLCYRHNNQISVVIEPGASLIHARMRAALGTVLSWDASSTKQPEMLRQAIITSKSTTAIALANIVIIVANESTHIMPY